MLKRRDFLRATLVTAGTLAVPACGGPEIIDPVLDPRALTDGAEFFPQSIASGDPRPDSVILWARVQDGEEDLDLEVEVATDAEFTQRVALDDGQAKVKALAKHDHCVKVKVRGLAAGTVYYYRFIYVKGAESYVSRVGRTRTAPAPDADVPVRFAYVSCQDYVGRHYNAYLALAEEELDFFVHLGDYIYETTGDPTFQNTSGRGVELTDEEGAIALADGAFHAARSLSNYRELYRTYRSDANLQKVHESFPMIATWDDHEFSNDSYGATATYSDGRLDETDVDRRKAANQAWFEYQPVDYGDHGEGFEYDPRAEFPGDIRVYRDFVFGRHVHLVMTDLRSYRPDHLIPEGAFPGKVVLDQSRLVEEFGEVPEIAQPYVNIESFGDGIYASALTGAAQAAGYDAAEVTGNISVAFINQVVAGVNEGLPEDMQIPLIGPAEQQFADRGIAYVDLGKMGAYSSIGSRYFAIKDTVDVYAAIRYKETQGASEDVMGAEQESWFLETMEGSRATWKVWGNEYCLLPLAIDLAPYSVPEAFKRRFYMNLDAWDGFRNKRNELLARLVDVGNVVAITGDIHAFYAGTAGLDADPAKKIVEFVGGAVSSAPFREMLTGQVAGDPVLGAIPGAALLAAAIDSVLTSTETKINPHLAHANSYAHGYVVVEADGDALLVDMRSIDPAEVKTDYTSKRGDLKVQSKRFRTLAGESDIYRDDNGTWRRWDASRQKWI
ncbi:alkaline phosphatase D family protein [Sorangium sp. So ce1335]|uniref:alkaline phosphatase D family protein n=1 Tax=Sorangium sp. So ce1335 TaxID=3133335 RepID=UPI003F607B16